MKYFFTYNCKRDSALVGFATEAGQAAWKGAAPATHGIVCAGRKVVKQSGNWETEMDRLSESGAIAGSKELWTCRAAVAPLPRTAPPRPDGRASLSPDPASPAARDPRGCSSPFPHRSSLWRRLRPRENAATLLRGARACLALLAAAALLALAAPAQAQTEVWTATLTPGDLSSGILGCSVGVATAICSSTSVLSEDSFNYDSTDYNITGLFLRSNGRFEFRVHTDITTDTLADLTLVVGSTSLVLSGGTASGAFTRYWNSSGVSLTEGTDITVKLTAASTSNAAPTVANAILDQTATVGTALNYAFPTNTFADTDAGDTLTYTATKSDDSALPSWLSFAPATRTFSGTPTAAEVGTVSVKVTASDGTDSVSDTFDIVVSAANIAPIGAPTITGTARVGWTLTAVTTGITDANGLTSPGFTYQWIRVNGTEADIAGENSSTYTLVAADLGKTIKVKVNFTDDDGYAETLTSGAYPTSGTVQADSTLVSNVGQAAGRSYGLGSHDLAQPFTTGANATGYTLTSIELNLDSTQSTITPTVKLYSGSANGTEEATFTGPAMLGPGSANYTFTPTSTVILLRSTTYWVVAEGTGNVFWRGTVTDEDATSAADWEIGDIAEARTANATGNFARELGAVYKIRVNGTLGGLVLSNDATLSALALEDASDDSAITISPAFLSGTTSYTADVDKGVGEITIEPTVNEGNATVEYLDSTDTAIADAGSGKTGQQISLTEGANTIKVKVTAQDTTTTNPYTVVVTRAAATKPGAPTGLTATANGQSQIDLAWTAPADTGGSAITGYKIEVSPDGSSWSDLVAATASTATTYAHTGLTAVTTRHYRVSAINAVGTSDPSGSDDATSAANTVPAAVNEVPVDWALKPIGIDAGEQFRLMFVTSTTRDATSTNIADYNTFVSTRAAAGLTAMQTYANDFTALVSTETVNARTNTLTRATDTDVPIYWVLPSGTVSPVAKVADDYADLYDGTWDSRGTGRNESGAFVTLSLFQLWTGTNTDGTTPTTQFMGATGSGATARTWRVSASSTHATSDRLVSSSNRILALSPVFQVAASNTPATGAPSISGTATVRQVLTATTGTIADADGLPANFTYQWVRVDADGTSNEADITGENSSTYTLDDDDEGKKIKVKVSFTDTGGNSETRTSGAYPTSGTVQASSTPVSAALVSNTGQTHYRILNVNPRFVYAQGFSTGNSAAELGSVTLADLTNVAAGESLVVSLYSESAGLPGTSLHTLTAPGTLSNGDATFTVPTGTTVTLEATTSYFIHIAFAGASGVVKVSTTASDTEDSGGTIGWSLADNVKLSTSGGAFGDHSAPSRAIRLSINGTLGTTTTNNAPTSADEHVEADEDMDYTFSSADFLFTDTAGDSLASIKIVTLPASGTGTLTLSGTVIGSGDLPKTVLAAEIDTLKYSPPANLYGTDVASFTFKVNDGTVDSDDAYTMNIDVKGENDPATGEPTISGTARVGRMLAASTAGIMDVDGLPSTFSYQWLRKAGPTTTSISGENSSTYTLQAADLGNKVAVRVSFTDDDGSSETLTSAATATVTTAITVSYVPLESEVTEGAGSIDLRISVTSHPTAGTPQAFEVLLSTADGTATVADDYVVVSGLLIQFGIGDTSKDHTILIIDDSVVESDETFTSTLSIGSGQPAVIDTRTDFGATATITIKDDDTANTAPTSADEHVEADEDMDYTFSSADFLFTDTDTGDSLASIKIVTLPASGTGTLTLSGTVIGSGDLPKTVLAAEIGNLKYSPPANLNGLDFATFTFKVNDGTVDSDDAFTITVDVTAMNDPATGKPGITGTAQVGQTLTATVGTIADVEGVPNPFFSAAATTVQWIQVDGANETDISGATNETYTLATADEGKKIKVKVSFEDGDGTAEGPLTSDAYPASATVTAANTAPTSADEHVEADEDTDYTFEADDFLFTDTDTGDSLASIKIVTLPASGKGTLTLSGTVIGSGDLPQTVLAAEIDNLKFSPPANLNGLDFATFTFKVNDGTVDSDDAFTITVDVTAMNDPATGEPTISGTARVGRMLTVSTAGIMDVDGLPSTFSYRWLRKVGATTTSISGANSSTYTLQAADLGNKVAVRVSFTDTGGNSEMRTSGDYPTSGTVLANNTLVSNAGQIESDFGSLAADDLAQSFTTGTNATGYTLSSIELNLDSTVSTNTPTVKLYSGSANGTEVSTFTGPATLGSGIASYTFTPFSTVTLRRSTTYWVVAEGATRWTHTRSAEDATPATGWSIADNYEFRTASLTGSFTATNTGDALQIRVNGTLGGIVLSSDATLSALALEDASDDSAITISPVFASATTSYTASVDNDVDGITIKPTVNESNATVEYLDSSDTEIADAISGKTGQQVLLAVGANTIKVKVTAEDTTTANPYTVVVTRAVVADTTPPEVVSVTVPISGSEVELVFDEDLDGNVGGNLLASVFSLTVAGQAVTIPDYDYAIQEAALFLYVQPGTIKQGQTVVVSYTDPTAGDDTVALQDIAGNDVASFTTGMSGVPAVTNDSTVTPNTAPTGADNTVTMATDRSYTFVADEFGFADTDAGDTLDSISIVTPPASGTLAFDGTAVMADDVVTKAQLDNIFGDHLTFTPAAGASGDPYTSFTFKVNDGTDDSAAAYTMSITVNAIGAVSTAEVPDNWALKPADIGAGEQFRLIFQASGHPATSADIATYNSHVRSDAGAGVTALRSYADDFRALVSTQAVNVRTNTMTRATDTGVPIYWVRSDPVVAGDRVADNYADFYDGSWATGGTGYGARGFSRLLDTHVTWTGSNANGTTHSTGYMGASSNLAIWSVSSSGAISTVAEDPPSSNYGIFALSPVFQVSTTTVNTAATGVPTITGTAQVGETLTAVTTGIMDADGLTSPTYTYQWIRVDGSEADIASANSSTYTLDAADLGKTIKVKVSFTDDASNTETLTSAATATVTAATVTPVSGVLVSNVGQTPFDFVELNLLDAAQSFTTGDNATGYTLTSIELRFDSSASTDTPTVKLYSGSANGTEEATLIGPAMLDADTTKNYAFTSSSTVTLGMSTTYWVVAEANTGSVRWIDTHSPSEDATPAAHWTIADGREDRSASSTGSFMTTAGNPLLIRVNGTTVATPTTSSDATLSALALENASDDSAITISPTFASGTTSYTASVDNDVDGITIKPTVNESSATVEYLDSSDTAITDADAVKAGQQVSLLVGANTIKVKVTAEDTTTTNTYTVVVTRAANTAPTSADERVEADEDFDYTFSSDDFAFTDTDTGDSLASVKIVTLPASGTGTLTLSGTAIGSGDLPKTVLAAEIDELKYSPPANLYGTDVATFTFKVNDGTDDSADAYTMTIGVTAVNPATGAPAISGAAAVGQALTASTSGIEDVDGLTGASFTYQWVRVDADGTSNEEDISVATSASYTLVGADVGKRVRVRVTFNDDAGNAEGPLTSEAFPSSGTVGSANALTIRRLGGGTAGICAATDTRPNPPVGGVFCLGVWFNGADPVGFTESDLEIENGTVVDFQSVGSTNTVQRITVNVTGDIGKEFVFRIVRNALDAGNAEAVYRATITAPPATLTMSSSAAEPVTGDFFIGLEFTHTVEGERGSLEPLTGRFPMITNINIGRFFEVTNGNLVRYANFAPIGDRNFDLVVRPYANFEGRLSVVFHTDRVQSADYSGIWFPEARFGIEVDTKSPTLETVALADDNRRLLDLTFHEELVAGSLPTVNDFRVVADGGSVGLATLHAPDGNTLRLRLSEAIAPGADATVSYIVPSTSRRLKDEVGNETPAFSRSFDTGPPEVTIAPGPTPVTEAQDAAAMFTLSRTGATAATLTVNVTVSETGDMIAAASEGAMSVNFEAGSETATLSVPIQNDSDDEIESTLSVDLVADTSEPPAYTLGAPAKASVTVEDDDTPNTAPTSADRTVTTAKDRAYAFTAADFSFADADSGDTLASVKIVTLPALGTLALDGTAVMAEQVVTKADIDDDKLTFTPVAGASGDPYATFTFKVNDGTDDSADAYTMTIHVTAVNPATGAPAISGAAAVGQALTASTSGIEDVDGLTGASFTYQWVRVDADGTSNEEDISVATSASYTLVGADVGKRVRVRVTFNDDAGNAEGPLTSEAFPSSGTVGSANALTIRRLGGGIAGICAATDTRPNPPVGGVFCLGVWFNGADPVGFTESDLEIENGTVVDFQSVGSTNTVQRITVNVTGDIGKEFVFRIVRNALDAGNAEAVYRATITAPPATLTMSSSAAEPVTGDFFIDLEFTHTVEGERGSLEPLTGRFPMITNINIGRFFEVTNGNLVRYANFAPIGDRNFDLVVRPYANFEGRLSVVFHSDRVESADYSGIWFPEARFGIEVDTKSPTLETVALADDNRRLLDLTFHEELVAGSLPTVNDFRVVADGGSVGLATLHAPDGNTLRLRLSEAIAPGADATVSYIVPSTSRRLKDEVGNETPAFSRSFDTGPPEVTIAPGPTPVTEAQDAAAMFTLSRTGATAATLTVNVTVSETGDMIAAASEGAMSVNFEAGSETATLSVPIQNDSVDEIESTLTVDLVADTSEPPAYTLGAPAKASVTVEDDNTPNTAPMSEDRTVTTAEDRPYAFTAADFSFADADGNTLASVLIVTTPADGRLALNGTTVMASRTVTRTQIDDGNLIFEPATGGSGDPYTTFTFKVNDGTDDSASAYTMTIDVTAATAPGAPTALTATANGQSQIDLAWTAPADTGGPAIAITGYRIEVSPDGSSWSDLVAATASTATTYAHTGLNAATNRHYRVSAINAVGTSDPSGSDDATTEASTATAQTEMVPVDWALKPADIGVGEQFRLMFATSTFRNARSTNIADYNTFVRTSAAAGLTALHTYANDFTALVSTGSVNARANTLTRATDTDAPVYWVRSSVDATHRAADGYADFFDGSWATSWRGYNESGSQLSTTRFWTGSNTDGTTHATQFMGPTGATASAAHWLLATPDNVTGSTPSLSTSRIVALSPVFQVANTAPTGADKTVTIGSDTAYTFEADDFGFVDTDAGATLVSVRIESVPLAGDLELNGTAVSLNDVIPSADIGDLTFTPAAGGSGDAYASFMFKVNDGTDFSANVNTITFNVRDLSCAAPDFAGDNRRQLWTGIVTVGEIDDVGYGFRSDLSQTELNDTTFAIGRNSYTVDSASVLSASPFVGQMRFSLAGNEQNNLTAGERAALRLHVCDTAIYNFSASGANAENTYDWAGSLDWSPPVATRTLYLSLPANRDAMGEPAITGTAQVGQDLTADVTGITDADGLTGDLSTPTDDSNLGGVEYSYQWIRVDADGASNEEDISGEIAETYTLTDDDEGKKVKVKVGFTDDLNGEEERTSAAYPSSGTVTAANTAPVFSSPSVSRSIAENTAAGQNVGAAVTATDADAGDTLAYTLGGTDAASFDFVEATGQIRTKTGVSYDFEAKSSYTVTVTASDGTATAVATVTISITDVAEPPDAPTTIPVSAVAGSTTSLTVSWTAPANAGRPDIDNYDVQYRVSGATAWTDGPQNVTTTTTTIAGLVADTLYEVQVRATNAEGDSGWSDPPVSGRTNAPPNTAPTSADEHVEADEDTDYTFSSADFPFTDTAGDSLASIKIVTLPASGTGTLTLSGTTIGSGDLPKTVLTAEIDDLKYSPPANLYGTDFATFTFKVNDGTVDSDDAFTITVDVTAMNDPATGKPGITGTAQVGQTLTATAGTIADVEGVPNPFFSAAATTVQWIQVDGATETDISGATNETYTLATADEGKKIKVKVSFEDEDGTAEGPLTSDAYPSSATVTAAPVTNNAPVFSSPSVSREIAENTAAGQNVGAAVTATDADAGDTLGYTLGGTDAASFDFVESSGQIRTKTNVSYDFEAKDSYTVTVTASDGTATAVATVTISITDVAEPPDAPPTISVSAVAGSTTSLTVSWTAPANAGRPAIDNYDVQYRVSGAAAWTDGPQNVTTTTTTISGLVADTLYEVQVRATNAEGDSGWSDPPVSGRTNSPANNAPEFATDTTSRSFTETVGDAAVSTAGNVGAVVTATDADSDTLTYSLEGTDVAKFGIVSGSGQIQTKVGEKYDREAKASYSVTVKADDSNGGSDTIAVTITVDNAVEKPLAPAMPAVTATSGITTSLDVSWMAPANTGRPAITGYKVEYRAGVSGNWINHRAYGHRDDGDHRHPDGGDGLPGAGARGELRRRRAILKPGQRDDGHQHPPRRACRPSRARRRWARR